LCGKSPSPQRKPSTIQSKPLSPRKLTAPAAAPAAAPAPAAAVAAPRRRSPSPPGLDAPAHDDSDDDVDVESFSRTFGVINVRSSAVFTPPAPRTVVDDDNDDDEKLEVIEIVESDDIEAVLRDLAEPPAPKTKTIQMPIVVEREPSNPTLVIEEIDMASRESFMPPPPTDADSDSDDAFPPAPGPSTK
jgi:hypothetical protein